MVLRLANSRVPALALILALGWATASEAAWFKAADPIITGLAKGAAEPFDVRRHPAYTLESRSEHFAVYRKTGDEGVAFHIRKISFLPEATYVIVTAEGAAAAVFMTIRTFRDAAEEQGLVGFQRALADTLRKSYGAPEADYYQTYFKHRDETLFNCMHRYTLRYAAGSSIVGSGEDGLHPNSTRCLPPDECTLRTEWREGPVQVNLSAVAFSPELVTLRLLWQNTDLLKNDAQTRDFHTLLTPLLLAPPE